MKAPTRPVDPERDKSNALYLAKYATEKAHVEETTRNNAIRFAADEGASLREIADATGLPHMTVKRIIDRTRARDPAE